jgi:hypothetical protein
MKEHMMTKRTYTPLSWLSRGFAAVAMVFVWPAVAFAQGDTLFVDSNGNVGLGTSNPQVELHVLATGEAPTDVQFLVEANTDPAFDFKEQDSGVTWRFINNNGAWKVADVGTGADAAEELVLTQSGNLAITGFLFTKGACSGGCDLVFSPEYELPTIEEHASAMWASGHLPAIGPTPEEGQFNLSLMTGGMLNELEKAHLYIQQLHERLESREEVMHRLTEQNDELARRLERVEALLEQHGG